MKIILLGPVSPASLVGHLSPSDSVVAESDDGVHGPSIGALASALLDLGHELVIVTHRRGHGPLTLKGPRLEFHRVESRSSARRQILDGFRFERRQMESLLETFTGDIVHAHWTYEWALVSLASTLPKVVTIHDAPLSVFLRNRSPYWLLRYLLAVRFRLSAQRISFLAVSPYVARRWSMELGLSKSVDVIPNCMVESTVESPESAVAQQFIEVSNASKLKNVRRLIEAFAIVRRAQPDVQLVLIGNGLDAEGKLAVWARHKGFHANVRFLGPQSREKVARLLHQSAVHVHSSLEESFGLTLIEAMSAGLPVIAGSTSGATSWVLDEGRCGVLVDMRNVDEMSTAMLSLISDQEQQQKLAEAGRARFVTRFRSDSVAKAHIKHFERVLSE